MILSTSTKRFDPSWLLASLLLLTSCDRLLGEGSVQANFTVGDCPVGDSNSGLEDYGFEAAFLGTTRFNDDVSVQIYEHAGSLEDTDGLSIRFNLADLLRAGTLQADEANEAYNLASPPLRVPLSHAGAVSATLSMFHTCPHSPAVYAASGTLEFNVLRLVIDPDDTGDDERIEGTMTATVVRGVDMETVGTVQADFQFDVPKRPLMSFR